MFRKVVLLVSIIIGTYIGAGFASGKEISCYLAKFGYISIPFSILCCVAFYFLMKKVMLFSCELSENKKDFASVFGKYSLLINLFITASAIITIAGTISGSRVVAGTLFPKSVLIIQVLIILTAFFICVGGIKKIGLSNLIIVPTILIFLLAIYIIVFKSGSIAINNSFCNDYFMAILSFVFYLCSNFFMLGILLLQIGKNYTKKEIKLTAFLSSFLLCFFICGYCVTLLVCGSSVINSEMPLITICFKYSRVMGALCSVILWFALFTTLISCVFVASNYVNKVVKSRVISVLLVLALGYLISFFGFQFVVSYLYALIGVFGMFFLIILFASMKNKT